MLLYYFRVFLGFEMEGCVRGVGNGGDAGDCGGIIDII